MPVYVQNTLSGQKEELKPVNKGKVSMYVCGPTVYDDPHIGHLRSAFIFEVLRKTLEGQYEVNFVRNITDIDDKIIDRSKREGSPIHEITAKYARAYHHDLEKLGIRPPTHEPRATEADNIHDMISIVVKLIQNGLAYEADGNVYFRTRKFSSYGALSHQNLDQVLENWRVEPGKGKEESLDFALWKKSKEDEPSWGSPWGQGRPGWHIECSAMSARFCGEEFDIHGGGKDLLFPHHENERAQSMGCFNKPFARVWIHHGLVTTESRKMSKSLGNFITLDQVLEKVPVDVLKLFFLQSHYSQDADFTWEKMESTKEAVGSFTLFFEKLAREAKDAKASTEPSFLKEKGENFQKELEDDFNTPKALAVLFEVLREGNRFLTEGKFGEALACQAWIFEHAKRVGLFENWHPEEKAERFPALKELMDVRKTMRQKKQYKVSDFIRAEMIKLGLHIEDAQEDFEVMGLDDVSREALENRLKDVLKKAKEIS